MIYKYDIYEQMNSGIEPNKLIWRITMNAIDLINEDRQKQKEKGYDTVYTGIKIEPPKVLTPKNVMYYSHHAKEVNNSIKHKAQIFLDMDLVEYDFDVKCYIVKPIAGYNTRTYTIQKRKTGFECNCQGCQTKIKKGLYDPEKQSLTACSHILAVYLLLKIKNWRQQDEQQE